MRTARPALRRSVAWALAAGLALAASPAAADHHESMEKPAAEAATPPGDQAGTPGTTQEWNQEAVAAVAQELAAAVKDLRAGVRKVPGASIASMQAASWHRFRDNLRLIESESKVLARQLGQGDGHDATYPLYQRIWVLVRDAREDARRMAIPQDVQAKIDAARAVLEKLDAYYA